jgi:Fic family protein
MNNWIPLLETLSQLPILSEVDRIKKELDALRPLSQEVEGRVMQKLKLEWNFHSNAIEGNKLTYGETYTFLMYGLTAKGKPFKDHLDIKGHDEAIKFLISLAKDEGDLTEVDIRSLHKVILVESYESPAITPDGQKTHKIIGVGEYKKLPNHVKTPTGETHYYATPEDVPILMSELVGFINLVKRNQKIHPSVLAAFFHHRFVAIHPFDDGNGRLGRILMNLVLMQHGFPPAIIKLKERTDYYAALGQADKNEYEPIIEFVAEALLDSMNLYLKAAKGGNIEESEDLDKEIALFKGSFEKKYSVRTRENTIDVFNNVFESIFRLVELRLSKFDDLFTEKKISFVYDENLYEVGFPDVVIDSYPRDFNSTELQIVLKNKDFSGIRKILSWHDFNKSIEKFDFYVLVNINFNRNNYQILYKDNYELLSKAYDEIVSDLEKQEVADKINRLVFEDLKTQTELLK